MAIYHLNAKVMGRAKGQSAIAAAAYRSGERLRDEKTGEIKSYQRHEDRILFTAILAPADARAWAYDRERLWNEVERVEIRKDAQLAREFEVSLPHELTHTQREILVKEFAQEAFVRRGYVVDVAIHAPYETSDQRNYHAHLLVTMRTLSEHGWSHKKDRSLNSKAQLAEWREHWADLTNRHLERLGHKDRVDHRSLVQQGYDRDATLHVGYAAAEIERRGGQSERMEALRSILERNELRIELKQVDRRLGRLERLPTRRGLGRSNAPSDPKQWSSRAGLVDQQSSANRALKEAEWEATQGVRTWQAGQGSGPNADSKTPGMTRSEEQVRAAKGREPRETFTPSEGPNRGHLETGDRAGPQLPSSVAEGHHPPENIWAKAMRERDQARGVWPVRQSPDDRERDDSRSDRSSDRDDRSR